MKSCELFITITKHSNLFLLDRHQTACARFLSNTPAKSVQTASVLSSSPIASPSNMAWQERASTVKKSLKLLLFLRECECPLSEWVSLWPSFSCSMVMGWVVDNVGVMLTCNIKYLVLPTSLIFFRWESCYLIYR